jgi:hypothetical protein
MRPGRVEVVAVAALYGVVLVVTVLTYARLPADELYNVTRTGLAGGFGRGLMEINFPDAIVAVPFALVAADVLRSAVAYVAAAVAVAACLVTALPGVWNPANIDAKPVNAVPAVGVAIVAALVIAALSRLTTALPRLAGDRLRVGLAIAIAVVAIPYVFAEFGFYAPDPILADEPTPGKEDLAAVHLGSHEGMDGALVAVAALALSRLPPYFTGRRLAAMTSTALALLLSYGVANLVQDSWLEQVYKRGSSDWKLASFATPQLSWRWAVAAAAGIAIEWLWFRRERAGRQEEGSTALTTS